MQKKCVYILSWMPQSLKVDLKKEYLMIHNPYDIRQ